MKPSNSTISSGGIFSNQQRGANGGLETISRDTQGTLASHTNKGYTGSVGGSEEGKRQISWGAEKSDKYKATAKQELGYQLEGAALKHEQMGKTFQSKATTSHAAALEKTEQVVNDVSRNQKDQSGEAQEVRRSSAEQQRKKDDFIKGMENTTGWSHEQAQAFASQVEGGLRVGLSPEGAIAKSLDKLGLSVSGNVGGGGSVRSSDTTTDRHSENFKAATGYAEEYSKSMERTMTAADNWQKTQSIDESTKSHHGIGVDLNEARQYQEAASQEFKVANDLQAKAKEVKTASSGVEENLMGKVRERVGYGTMEGAHNGDAGAEARVSAAIAMVTNDEVGKTETAAIAKAKIDDAQLMEEEVKERTAAPVENNVNKFYEEKQAVVENVEAKNNVVGPAPEHGSPVKGGPSDGGKDVKDKIAKEGDPKKGKVMADGVKALQAEQKPR